MDTRIRW